MAESVSDSAGVFFVPAFNGLQVLVLLQYTNVAGYLLVSYRDTYRTRLLAVCYGYFIIFVHFFITFFWY